MKALPSLGLSCLDGPGIHAKPDDKYPALIIDWNDAECLVSYQATKLIPTTNGVYFSDLLYPLAGYELHILKRQNAAEATGTVNTQLNNKLQEFFGPFNGSDEILFLIKEGIGFIPYMEYAMPVVDSIEFVQEMGERRTATQYTATMLEQSTLLSELYGRLGCDAVVTYASENPNSVGVSIYKGMETDAILSRLNATLANNDSEIPPEIKLPIDYSTLMSNPKEVDQMLKDLNIAEANYVVYGSKGGADE
jgi:hypothetical protein